MLKVDDCVMYGLVGACRIIAIEKERFSNCEDNEIEYYVLEPVFSNRSLSIRIPVDNKKVLLRPIISKDEAAAAIARMPDIQAFSTRNEKECQAIIKEALKSGDMDEWIKVIKTLDSGKKLSKVNEESLHTAEKQLHEEFAVVLGILPDEVVPYIQQHSVLKSS